MRKYEFHIIKEPKQPEDVTTVMHPHFPDIVGVDQFAEIIQLFSYLLDDIGTLI